MAIKRRRGGSASRIAKLLSRGEYGEAAARGKKAEAGQKLGVRRKKMTKIARAEIEAAEKEFRESLEKAGGESSLLDTFASILGIAAMFNPALTPFVIGLQGLSTKDKMDYLKSSDFEKYKTNVLDKIDVGKYKNTFLEDYVAGAEKSLGEAWDTSKDRMISSLGGGFMQNAIFSLASMGGGKQQVDPNVNVNPNTNVTIPKVNQPTGGLPSTITPLPPNQSLLNKILAKLGGGGTEMQGYNPLKWKQDQAGIFPGLQQKLNIGQELPGLKSMLKDRYALQRLGASQAHQFMPGWSSKDLGRTGASQFQSTLSSNVPSWLTGFNKGYWG